MSAHPDSQPPESRPSQRPGAAPPGEEAAPEGNAVGAFDLDVELPPWRKDELPEPLPFNGRNLFRTIGPGAILLAASIGGGEWLVGPKVAVDNGRSIFIVATVAIILQLFINLEGIRYTLYTGEPILTGIMRLKPGSWFWGRLYVLLTIVQLAVPALAKGAATVVLAAALGRVAQQGEFDWTAVLIAQGIIVATSVLLLFGGTVERMLERLSWAMIAYIFLFLVSVNLLFVPASHAAHTALGFFGVGPTPSKINLLLLATLAATAGSGGIGNLTVSNWIRDKGFGMGGKVGAIGSAFGGEPHEVSHVGKVFEVTADNLRKWRLWWNYVAVDQLVLWGGGCFLGMFLNVNLATYIVPATQTLSNLEAGVFQAKYMASTMWSGLWYLGLLNGFWILFSTHMGNTDVMVRTVTDTLWVASPRVRRWKGGNIALIYYVLLGILTCVGLITVGLASALALFTWLGFVANLVLALAAVQIAIVNTRLLPRELRPRLWQLAGLLLAALFFGGFFVVTAADQILALVRPALAG